MNRILAYKQRNSRRNKSRERIIIKRKKIERIIMMETMHEKRAD